MYGNQAQNEGLDVVPVKGAVKIDGVIDPAEWDLSGQIWSFADWDARDQFSVKTAAMYDKDYLYLSFDWRDLDDRPRRGQDHRLRRSCRRAERARAKGGLLVLICDSNVMTGYPSTNNWVEVVDGASFRADDRFWLGKSGTNCGNARCRVVNSEFYSDGLGFYTQDASLGGGFFEVGGTNGHANVQNLVRQSSGDLHLKFSVPEGGQTSGKPYIDVRYSATMSIPEAGVTADLDLDWKWATSGRKNFVDLMRISRGGSAADYPKQSARLTTIMNSIPKASLNGCTLSIVTNTSDTVFSNSGTYTLRLNAGPRQGLMLLFK